MGKTTHSAYAFGSAAPGRSRGQTQSEGAAAGEARGSDEAALAGEAMRTARATAIISETRRC